MQEQIEISLFLISQVLFYDRELIILYSASICKMLLEEGYIHEKTITDIGTVVKILHNLQSIKRNLSRLNLSRKIMRK